MTSPSQEVLALRGFASPTSRSGDKPLEPQVDERSLELTDFAPTSSSTKPQLLEPQPRAFSKGWRLARTLWLVAFLPVFSGIYLAFCYAIHWETVVLRTSWMIPSVSNSNSVKTGITSVSILIVTIAILPVYTLISQIKSEEFFRVLSLRKAGVPLNMVNSVSTPAYGFSDHVVAIFRRQSSGMSMGAFFATLVVLVASTLAPAILSAELAQVDDTVMAIRVGAVLQNSIVNSTEFSYNGYSNQFERRIDQVSYLPWVEGVLGATYKWEAPPMNSTTLFAVPTPVDVPMGSPIRYVTDVVILQPTCQWAVPEFVVDSLSTIVNSTIVLFPNVGPTGVSTQFTSVVSKSHIFSLDMLALGPNHYTWNRGERKFGRERFPLADGTVIWAISKCEDARQQPGTRCGSAQDGPSKTGIDMGDLPFTTYKDPSPTAFSNQTWNMYFLLCSPNLQVDTREVLIRSNNSITVRELDSGYVRQRNIDETQIRFLAKRVFEQENMASNRISSLTYSLGLPLHANVVFGREVAGSTNLDNKTITPLSVDQITRNYAVSVQSLFKALLDGTIAARPVPARMRISAFILASSLPHVIVSTLLFIILSVFLVICHFRTPVPQFTFVSVAAALADSECPGMVKDRLVAEQHGGVVSEYKVLNELKGRVLVAEGLPGRPNTVLHLTSSNDP